MGSLSLSQHNRQRGSNDGSMHTWAPYFFQEGGGGRGGGGGGILVDMERDIVVRDRTPDSM
jgi:hypothetical protein